MREITSPTTFSSELSCTSCTPLVLALYFNDNDNNNNDKKKVNFMKDYVGTLIFDMRRIGAQLATVNQE